MNSDIITSAPDIRDLASIVRAARAGRKVRPRVELLRERIRWSIAQRTEAALVRVLAVRARLPEPQQRLFDDLAREGTLAQVIEALLRGSEEDALAVLRYQLGGVEPIVSTTLLARRVHALRAELTADEYLSVISFLPHLASDEQWSLYVQLRGKSAAAAAALLRRTVLAPKS